MAESGASRGDDLRARDTDRVAAMAALDDAYADGQLDGDEYRARVGRARTAITVGELSALTTDLQSASGVRAVTAPPMAGRGAGVRAVLATLGVVVTSVFAAIVVISAVRDTSGGEPLSAPQSREAAAPTSWTGPMPPNGPPTGTKPSDVVKGPMLTAEAIREAIDKVRERFGSTVVEGLRLYTDSAELRVLDPKAPLGTTQYSYTPGGMFHDPVVYGGTSMSSGPPGEVVDLDKVNVDRLLDLIAAAPQQLRLTPQLIGQVRFQATIGPDDGGEIWIGVNSNGLDSHLVSTLNGTIKGVHPCTFGC